MSKKPSKTITRAAAIDLAKAEVEAIVKSGGTGHLSGTTIELIAEEQARRDKNHKHDFQPNGDYDAGRPVKVCICGERKVEGDPV